MTGSLFDKSSEYDAQLQRGLIWTGHDRMHFMRARIEDLGRQLGSEFRPRRILDFGCGIGDCVAHLAGVYPDAEVVGVDTAERAIQHAQRTHAAVPRTSFLPLSEFVPQHDFDLCHCSGVFHHIVPAERPSALAIIRRALNERGRLALIENNPWNLGTRWVMSRIPFDADADPLSVLQATRLLRDNGFTQLSAARFLFWFPRWLAPLRALEPGLTGLPFGGQYYVLCRKDSL
ncbi:MAG TPA: class I SAM-dependent methyltransferase [Polyangiales bacterium]|nr:class I SAM-dependent methyltransferase [Polyangiales bacterium]